MKIIDFVLIALPWIFLGLYFFLWYMYKNLGSYHKRDEE